jgi:HD-GYP domain-containing protein (c-di-GMP phosphodiesterase class II)
MPSENLQETNRLGEAFIRAINSLAQTARIYHESNELMVAAVVKFQQIIAAARDGSPRISLQIVSERFYFQSEKLLVRPVNAKLYDTMLRYFENRGIYGLHIDADLKQVERKQIVAFVKLLNGSSGKEDPSAWLENHLKKTGLHWVSIDYSPATVPDDAVPKFPEAGPSPDSALKKMQVRRTYSHVLGKVKEMAQKLTSNQSTGIRQSVRLIQKMVDIITEDESLFLGISTVRVYDDYTYTHSLNVAILSMCLGKRVGLPHLDLERLGLCGLFHDLGKVEIPKGVLNKKGKLDPAEYTLLKSHSMHSARLILKLKAKRDRKIRMLVPPFEHHVGYDHSGYPHIADSRQLSLFGRILTITDVYDAITSPRIYRPSALSPDRALKQMLAQSGTQFDPILLKVFAQMLGVYPVGTLLKLDTSEIGIVAQACPESQAEARPILQLLETGPEGNFRKGPVVDLSDLDPDSGRYLRNIVSSMHPSAMRIQPAEFLL